MMWNRRLRHSVLAAFLGLTLSAGCGGVDTSGTTAATSSRTSTIQSLSGDSATGQSLFVSECARCHGSDGKGGNPGPNLTGRSEATVVSFALNGKGSEMPSFATLSDQNIADISAFVRSIQ